MLVSSNIKIDVSTFSKKEVFKAVCLECYKSSVFDMNENYPSQLFRNSVLLLVLDYIEIVAEKDWTQYVNIDRAFAHVMRSISNTVRRYNSAVSYNIYQSNCRRVSYSYVQEQTAHHTIIKELMMLKMFSRDEIIDTTMYLYDDCDIVIDIVQLIPFLTLNRINKFLDSNLHYLT